MLVRLLHVRERCREPVSSQLAMHIFLCALEHQLLCTSTLGHSSKQVLAGNGWFIITNNNHTNHAKVKHFFWSRLFWNSMWNNWERLSGVRLQSRSLWQSAMSDLVSSDLCVCVWRECTLGVCEFDVLPCMCYENCKNVWVWMCLSGAVMR